jgi:hypothetical protein
MFRRATDKEYYSRVNIMGDVHLFVDVDGNPTVEYPHVHIIHFQQGGVTVVVSLSSDEHPWKREIQNPAGQEVESTVAVARSHLVERKIRLLCGQEEHGYILYRRQGDKWLCTAVSWKGQSINAVTAIPRVTGTGVAVTIRVNELFDMVWGSSGATHDLPC